MFHKLPRYTCRKRTRRARARQSVDRFPIQVNGTLPAAKRVAAYCGVSVAQLQDVRGNHLLCVDLHDPVRLSDDGKTAIDGWGPGWSAESQGDVHTFAPMAAAEDSATFPWPDSSEPDLPDEAKRRMAADNGSQFVIPDLGMCLFERARSLRSFEAFLRDLGEGPEWVEGILDLITEIQVVLVHRFIAAGVTGEISATTKAPSGRGCFRHQCGAGLSSYGWPGCWFHSAMPVCP